MTDVIKRLKALEKQGEDNIWRTAKEAREEIERLQRIIDSRPAINAGLPETYIEWSRGIYQCEINQQVGYDD